MAGIVVGGDQALPRMQGKHSQDPRLGDCGVAKWFIRVEICPGFPISHLSILPQNKSYCVLSKAKTKASV